MDTKLIKERVAYWTSRECYRHAAKWAAMLSPVQVIKVTPLEAVTNTLNNGGR